MGRWVDGWMGMWMDGCKSRFKACLQKTKILNYILSLKKFKLLKHQDWGKESNIFDDLGKTGTSVRRNKEITFHYSLFFTQQ